MSTRDGGKGDAKRPLTVSEEQFNANWDTIFKSEPVVLAAMPLADGGQILIKSDGSKVITNGKGEVSMFDKDCNPIEGCA